MDIMSRLQKQNTAENAGRYRAKKLSAVLPEMQARNSNQRKTTENHNTQRARRTDAEPINRAISRDLLALYV